MKYLDFAPYFNGVRERDARNGGCGSVCAGGGRSSGDPSTRTVVYMSHCLFFLPVKRKGKMGVREWGGGGGAGEIILFWNLDSGAGRPRSQSIWPVWGGWWGGSAGRGVLGGLIRRMLSHHPSRQAAENWLAPRRVEFTGGAGGVGGGRNDALDTCHSLWSVSGSQQQINKISFLLLFTCRGSSPSPSLQRPFDPSDY